MSLQSILDDPGIDQVAHDVRRSESARLISVVLCAIVLGFNLGLQIAAVWGIASLAFLAFTHYVIQFAKPGSTMTRAQRMLNLLAMLLETLCWSWSAVLYWSPTNVAFVIAGVCVLCGQMIHAQSFVSRSRISMAMCGGPPALTLILFPALSGAFSGMALVTVLMAGLVVVWYAWTSAEGNLAKTSELEQQRSFSLGVMDAIDSRIGIVDRNGNIIHANRAWRDRMDVIAETTGEPLKMHFADHCRRLPGRRGRLLESRLGDMVSGQRDSFSIVYNSDLSATPHWFKLQARRLEGAGDAHIVVVQHQITELKQTEDQLRHANRVLRRARYEAEAANRAKSSFLATMGHEIRTPLNGVIAIADVLSRSDLKPVERDMVDTIRSSADTLAHLLADMLDVARIESGRITLETQPFALGDALREVIALSSLTASEKHLHLEAQIEPGADCWVKGDVTRFKQIMTNLITNAVKFTDTGTVTVSAGKDAEGAFLFTVADTGIGFDQGDAERLFSRFEQADSSVTRRFGGSGLGLAIVRQLVELMSGQVRCESRVGEGAVFRVTLPLPQIPAPVRDDASARKRVAATDLTPLSVLVVDDHPINRKVVGLILTGINAVLTMAENGKQAIDAFRSKPFDVILMDMQMPVMDGVAATEAIRELEQSSGLPRTPVIMFSANAMTEHLEQSRLAGADLHLSKPVTAAQLLDAVSMVTSLDELKNTRDQANRA